MRWSRYSINCPLPSHEEAIGVGLAESVGRCLHDLDAPILSLQASLRLPYARCSKAVCRVADCSLSRHMLRIYVTHRPRNSDFTLSCGLREDTRRLHGGQYFDGA